MIIEGVPNPKLDNTAAARLKWRAYAALHNKTPDEIHTAMQTRIDGWASLAAAKADLREWLPLMAALLAWVVAPDEHTAP